MGSFSLRLGLRLTGVFAHRSFYQIVFRICRIVSPAVLHSPQKSPHQFFYDAVERVTIYFLFFSVISFALCRWKNASGIFVPSGSDPQRVIIQIMTTTAKTAKTKRIAAMGSRNSME
jgi:hypothetical protein